VAWRGGNEIGGGADNKKKIWMVKVDIKSDKIIQNKKNKKLFFFLHFCK
jgi:hypothetical protein